MATISGTLKNASGVRPNTKIILTAYRTTSDVVTLAPDTTIITNANGSYSFVCNPSFYNVRIQQQGHPCENVGIIQVYSDSADGTINDFLTVFKPDDLTPEILKQCVVAMKGAETAQKAAEEAAANAADEYSQIFQDRFNLLSPIPWAANTQIEVKQQLQVFEYEKLFYLPDPQQLPFNTSATFDSSQFTLSELVTANQMRTDSASQLGGVYEKDYLTGDVIPADAMTNKLMYWYRGQFYSTGTDAGFTSNDFDADLAAGRFVSAETVTTKSINEYSTIYLKYTDIQPDGVNRSSKLTLLLGALETQGGYYVVKAESGTYISAEIEIPAKIILKGNGSRQTNFKAPENSTYKYVIQSKNFDSHLTAPTSGGAYCAGIDGISVDGSMDTFTGIASVAVGNGVRWFGVGQYINDVQIFNIPSIGLRTEGSHAASALNLPVQAYTIGVLNEIRINKTGNDGWHYGGSPDQFIDKVEISNQGHGYSYDNTPNSFIDTTRNVASFRQWATCEIGTMHCYGNWSGYGFIAGTDTSVFKVRTKYDHLITESCRVGAWFRPSSYVQGSILDVHTCSGDFPDTARGYSGKTPTLIFESDRASIHTNVQVFVEMDTSDGVAVHIGGANQNITCSVFRGLVSDNRTGTGVNIVGNDNNITLDVVGYAFGTDANGDDCCGTRFSAGKDNIVNASVGSGDLAYIVEAGGVDSMLSGVLSCKGSIGKAYTGFEQINYKLRRAIFLTYKGGNKTSAFSSGLDLTDYITKEFFVTVEELAYIPDVSEVDISLDILATQGSIVYPSLQFAVYSPQGSTTSSLKIIYKTINLADISPMQTRFAISVR